jgi:glycosyltransferase involved in cell wall biosynthesis
VRLLFLNWRDWTHPSAGGAEEDLRQYCRAAVEHGHSVEVFCARYSGSKPSEILEGALITRMGNQFSVYFRAITYLSSPRNRGKWDVVVDDINGVPWFAHLFASANCVSIFHHPIGRLFFTELPFPVSLVGWLIELSIPRVYRGQILIVRSRSVRQYLVDRGVPASNTVLIPAGLDRDRYRPSAEKAPDPTLLFVGPIKRYKHPEVAIRVLGDVRKKFPTARLDMIGWTRNGFGGTLIKHIDSIGLSRDVTLHGFVSTEEKVRLMSRSWVLLFPSEQEGWGLAAIEANACGTPVIAFAEGGLKDSVVHEVSGFLARPGAYDEMLSYTLEILSSESVRQRLNRGAMEWSGRFSWDHYYEALTRVLEERRACS